VQCIVRGLIYHFKIRIEFRSCCDKVLLNHACTSIPYISAVLRLKWGDRLPVLEEMLWLDEKQVIMIYLTLHWPFLINVWQCLLSIKRYIYSCRTWQPGSLNALFTELMCEIVAQWLGFWVVNQETMCSNPAETIFVCNVLFLLTCLLTQKTLNTVVVSNALLKCQPSPH